MVTNKVDVVPALVTSVYHYGESWTVNKSTNINTLIPEQNKGLKEKKRRLEN